MGTDFDALVDFVGIYLIMQPGAATVALFADWLVILLAGAAGDCHLPERCAFVAGQRGTMVGLFPITRPYTLVDSWGLSSFQHSGRTRIGATSLVGDADHRHLPSAFTA